MSPVVVEVKLEKHYSFQYQNFLVAAQNELYLLLEKEGPILQVLKFHFSTFKFGSPNDESRGSHPLMKFGLGWYGLYEVQNSPWIEELKIANRVHPSHKDSMFSDRRHFVACFKDVTLEVVCWKFEEFQIEESALLEIVQKQLNLNE